MGKKSPSRKPKGAKKLDISAREGAKIREEEFDPALPLNNQQWEAFAVLVSQGKNNTEAYGEVYKTDYESSKAHGSRLVTTGNGVAARVLWLQQQTAGASVMSSKERRERLARMVRCDLNAIDLEKDGDLIQEKAFTEFGVKLKLPGKRECIMADAELAGDLKAIERGVHVGVSVNVTVLTETERKTLMEQKRSATERRMAARN